MVFAAQIDWLFANVTYFLKALYWSIRSRIDKHLQDKILTFFFLKNGIIIICENTYSSFKKYFIKRISWNHFSHRSHMNHILPLWSYFGDLLRIWRLFYDCYEEAHVLFIRGLLWDQNYLCADYIIQRLVTNIRH